MENVLKSLKKAEESADEIDRQASAKASELVKKTEIDAKRLEADSERMAKEAGEALISSHRKQASVEADKISSKAQKEASGIKIKAKENMTKSVDDVVNVVIKRFSTSD